MPSAEDCATLQAYFEGVDQARADAEAEWGVDRLPMLVDDELRAKFNRQKVRWSTVLQDAWASEVLSRDKLDAVRSAAGGMSRAYAALADAASIAGHRPLSAEVWETRLADGRVAAVVRTDDEARHVIASGRHLAVYTLAEVANIIDALPEALQIAKTEFPGAKVLPREHDRSWVRTGDEIPF
jgi:hypothetical protein